MTFGIELVTALPYVCAEVAKASTIGKGPMSLMKIKVTATFWVRVS